MVNLHARRPSKLLMNVKSALMGLLRKKWNWKKSVAVGFYDRVFPKTTISRFSQNADSWFCGNQIPLIHVFGGKPKHGFSLLDGYASLRKTSTNKTVYPNKALGGV